MRGPAGMEIRGKVALITGASDGIGAACVREFRQRGAQLALTARSEERLVQVGGPQALAIAGDLTDPRVRGEVVARTIERYGRIDILINNAGVGLYRPAHSAPMEDARHLFELNLFAPLHLIQLVAPHMKRQGGGAIVNVGSLGGKITLPWFTLYSASKFALGSLTDGLRVELRRDGIHAMIVCPGYVLTGFQEHVLGGVPPPLMVRGRRFAISPERCARDIADGLERRRHTVMTPRFGWLLIALSRVCPWIVERRLESAYYQHSGQS